jgi:N-methylhydantoinase B/oxoprolinase/acetone carboxylase alpha subunit
MIETPAAGGFGSPNERSAEDLRTDLRSGKYSERFVAEHYPVQRMPTR